MKAKEYKDSSMTMLIIFAVWAAIMYFAYKD